MGKLKPKKKEKKRKERKEKKKKKRKRKIQNLPDGSFRAIHAVKPNAILPFKGAILGIKEVINSDFAAALNIQKLKLNVASPIVDWGKKGNFEQRRVLLLTLRVLKGQLSDLDFPDWIVDGQSHSRQESFSDNCNIGSEVRGNCRGDGHWIGNYLLWSRG